ncbi:PP2C family protein-serine/threonine phosphatase [Mycobacterium asiaticum]|uniref:PP2C family protein-serine/threonine phosphatase n=1 Tax=Mycobacterium asiaticum TaxID=1790 RepID=UPI000A846191|nr:GAF domain-containing SpoIIE family protein phosphatase [Mycobacterium asiaticum]
MHAVERYRVLDAPPDRVFGRIAGLAASFFGAPMAAVSVVGRDRIGFVAARGLADVRQIPREAGLCEPAIVSGDAYCVPDALTAFPTNPFAREHRIRFYACAPIVTSGGHRLGTVAVMDHEARDASREQLSVLEDLAAIVMEQLELRLSSLDALGAERRLRDAAEYARDDARADRAVAQRARDEARRDRDDARLDRDLALRDRDIAEYDRDLTEDYAAVLQQTLLPPVLPRIEGLSLAAHYHPASPRRVGGDFYDVFPLGDNRWAFFVGDVEGHGVEAAVATSLIRYTLRSAALHYRDPTLGLAELNAVLMRELAPRRFCTVLFGTLEPPADGSGCRVTMATGGHPPALLLDPAGGAEEVRSPDGMLVGMIENAVFDACVIHLRPGQTLLFYTDGIVEARHAATPFNQDNLAVFVAERASLGAVGLVEELTMLIPKLRPDDDIALLAITAA